MDQRDVRISRKIQGIAKTLGELLRSRIGETTGFALVIFPYALPDEDTNTAREYQYVSNCDRKHMYGALTAVVNKWKDRGMGDPELQPPHIASDALLEFCKSVVERHDKEPFAPGISSVAIPINGSIIDAMRKMIAIELSPTDETKVN